MFTKIQFAELRYGLLFIVVAALISYVSAIGESRESVSDTVPQTQSVQTVNNMSFASSGVAQRNHYTTEYSINQTMDRRLHNRPNEDMINGFTAECLAMTDETMVVCTAYALKLSGVTEAVSTAGTDETMINGFIAECLSMTEQSIAECTAYAHELAPFAHKAATQPPEADHAH